MSLVRDFEIIVNGVPILTNKFVTQQIAFFKPMIKGTFNLEPIEHEINVEVWKITFDNIHNLADINTNKDNNYKYLTEQLILCDFLGVSKLAKNLMKVFLSTYQEAKCYRRLLYIPNYQKCILDSVEDNKQFFQHYPECIPDLLRKESVRLKISKYDMNPNMRLLRVLTKACYHGSSFDAIEKLFPLWDQVSEPIKEALISRNNISQTIRERCNMEKDPNYLPEDMEILRCSTFTIEILDRVIKKYGLNEMSRGYLFKMCQFLANNNRKFAELCFNETCYTAEYLLAIICCILKRRNDGKQYTKFLPLLSANIRESF